MTEIYLHIVARMADDIAMRSAGEAMSAASRLISTKDQQLTHIMETVNASDAAAAARESVLQRQLEEQQARPLFCFSLLCFV